MQIYLYGGVFLGFLVLAFLSRKESSSGKRERNPFAGMAAYLYRRYRKLQAAGEFPHLPGEETARSDLATLYPSRQFVSQETNYHIHRLQIFLLILFAGDLIAVAAYTASGMNSVLQDGIFLQRDAVGGESRQVKLKAETAREGSTERTVQGEYSLTIEARKLSYSQVDALAESLSGELPVLILGENKDLQHISRPLTLPSGVDGYPFQIAWESSSYALVDTDGTVNSDGITGDASAEVVLTAVLTYDDGSTDGFRRESEIPLRVVQRTLSKEEILTQKIEDAMLTANEESAAEDRIALPGKIGDLLITWSEEPADSSLMVFLAAVLLAAASMAAAGSRLHQKIRDRARQMVLDYPQIVSKFVLYIGAGLSVRNVFGKLGDDYRAQREEGGAQRGAYEEILLVCRELDSGVPETEAYEHFGMRCRSRQYTRLCTLLAQNLKKGNQELLTALQEEARTSFEERRNTARELGEEAETKLLLPMIMMLAITMVIIIIPAYYSFSA